VIAPVVLLACLVLTSPLQDEVVSSATRGITGQVRVLSDGGLLRGRPDLDLASPLLVRLAGYEQLDDGRIACDIEFIGTDIGTFDLRDVLVFEQGGSTTSLDPIPIEIISNLAVDAPTDLVLATPPDNTLDGGYTVGLIIIGVLWLLVPLLVLAGRMNRPRVDAVIEEPEETVADRIAPLVAAAATRDLSIEEQGRLELLLYAHWQERLELESDRPAAVARLRGDPEAGRLLRAVERWLHAPDSGTPTPDEVSRLLEPYRVPVGGGVA
jgi:hypothetical protein